MPDHLFFKANKASSNLPIIHGHSTIFNQPPQVKIRQIIRSSWWLTSALNKPRHFFGKGQPTFGGAESYRNHPIPTSIAERLIRRRLQSKRSCRVNESSWAMQVTRDHGIDPRDMVCSIKILVRPLYIKYTIPFIHYLEEIPLVN